MERKGWGPHFIAIPDESRILSGKVLFKEDVDEGILRRELDSIGLSGPIVKIMNEWFIRKIGQDTWLQLGASDQRALNFPLHWDSSSVENGDYEVLEQMNVYVKEGSQHHVVSRTHTVRVAINN